MNTKWNLLVVLALLAALLGGTTGTVFAAGEPAFDEGYVNFEPSIVGFPLINAFAFFDSAGTDFTCTVDYGDGVARDGTVETVNTTPPSYRCNGPAYTYENSGTYGVIFTATDITDPLLPLSGSWTEPHTVVLPYAGMYDASSNVIAPGNALSAPDGQYATFGAAGGTLLLALGTNPFTLVTDASLTIYHTSTGPACQVSAYLQQSMNPGSEPVPVGSTVRGATSTVFTITPYFQGLVITCPAVKKGSLFGLDAIEVVPYTGTTRYGVAVYMSDTSATSPGLALGIPDGKYATLVNATEITLLMAQKPVGPGLLTVYYTKESPACMVLGQNNETGQYEFIGTTMRGAGSAVFNMPDPITLLVIGCPSLGAKEVFSLDAVKLEPVAPPPGYAMRVTQFNEGITNPNAAVWAPDGQHALITGSSTAAMLELDMGALVTGTLTFYHTSVSAPCPYFASVDPVDLTNPYIEPGEFVSMGLLAPNTVTSTFTSPAAFRYIIVGCSPGAAIGLDAVQFQPEMPKWYAAKPVQVYTDLGFYMTGAPDGLSAPVMDPTTTPPQPIVLDMGAPVHGLLTVYHTAVSENCMAELTDSNGTVIAYLGPTSAGATSTRFYVADDFQYFRIGDPYSSSCTLEVDALEVVPGEVTLDGYGYTFSAGAAVDNPTAALGAPDGIYASLPAGADSFISLNLGALFQGVLTITHSSTSPACEVWIGDAFDPSSLIQVGSIFTGSTVSILPIPASTFPDGIRYVVLDCSSLTQGTLDLDAAGVHPTVTTGYGQQVLYMTGNVKNTNYAVGQHDGLYATIGAPSGEILLYVGVLVDKPVTIYHSATSPSCLVYGVPLDILNSVEPSFVVPTTAGATSTTITPPAGEEISFIGLKCSGLTKKQAFQWDAVEFIP